MDNILDNLFYESMTNEQLINTFASHPIALPPGSTAEEIDQDLEKLKQVMRKRNLL